jgi:hypothetical protein
MRGAPGGFSMNDWAVQLGMPARITR